MTIIRIPGDADPTSLKATNDRIRAQQVLSRGPKTLRTLIADGYVGEIYIDRMFDKLYFWSPDGYTRITFYYDGNYFNVLSSGEMLGVNLRSVRLAASYYRALVDDYESDRAYLLREKIWKLPMVNGIYG